MSPKNKPVFSLSRFLFFLLALSFFLIPGQNFLNTLVQTPKTPKTRQLDFSLPMADYPVNITKVEIPKISAHAYSIMDFDSGIILAAKNESVWFAPGSTVKLMTALVALEQYQEDQVLTVMRKFDYGQDIALVKGEQISFKNLLYGLLVASGNDAAVALADNYPGGEKAFLLRMNQKAVELKLTKTYFANPTGLDTDNNDQPLTDYSYSSALDLGRLAWVAVKNDLIADIVATPEIVVWDKSGKISHHLYNINELLGHLPGIKGIKTGWTEKAGECLIALIERNNKKVITVVLGSVDRFEETKKLVDWVFNNFQWLPLAEPS